MAVYASSYAANLVRGKTCALVLGGPIDADYPASNLTDGDVTNPTKLAAAATGIWRIDAGAGVTLTPTIAAILNHNLDAGLAVSICGNATGNHGDAMLYTENFTIPADRADGLCTNPAVIVAPAAACRYHYLRITGVNSVAPAIGELWLGTYIEIDVPHGVALSAVDQFTRLTTPAGLDLIYEIGLPRRQWSGSVDLIGSTAESAMRTLIAANHRQVYPWLLWPDSSVNDVWLVRFMSEPAITHESAAHWTMGLDVVEVCAGEPL